MTLTTNNDRKDTDAAACVVVTGFGKFGNILTNPTSEICNKLIESEEERNPLIQVVRVMETSKEGVLSTLTEFDNNHLKDNSRAIYLHLGVNTNIDRFELESTAYNSANFKIPDERGWLAQKELLDPELVYECPLFTKLDVESIAKDLASTFQVGTSNDPGRFICNFVYYKSLQRTHSNSSQNSLFVHVPPFDKIPINVQMEFINALVSRLAK